MADTNDQMQMPREDGPGSDVPVEEQELEQPDHPRRAASAEFIVTSPSGSASILREAMDPANQSLGDALKLSYRVLQGVMIILVILFLVSGFRSVENDQTGVQTRFGRIIEKDGDAELRPGLQVSVWPYPISEFIVFNQNGVVDLSDTFWPNHLIAGASNFEEAAPRVAEHDEMRLGLGPGRDGYLLLSGNELGHIQLQAFFAVEDARDFVTNIGVGGDISRVVRLALQRAAVQTAAEMRLDDFIGEEEVLAAQIRERAQALLTDLNSGIRLTRVQVDKARPPLAVHTALGMLGQARITADSARTQAQSAAREALNKLAGPNHEELLDLIERYEELLLSSDDSGVVYSDEAQAVLAEIDAFFESDRAAGEIKQTVEHAGAYHDEIREKLGAHARRFSSLLPQYRANPEYVIKTQWIETVNRVLAQETVETFRVPRDAGNVRVAVTSDQNIMLKRREWLQKLRSDAAMRATGIDPIFQIQMGQFQAKQLMVDEQGRVKGVNE